MALIKPRARSAGRATGVHLCGNAAWLKQNAERYKGAWVALSDGKLLAAAPSRKELRGMLDTRSLYEAVFIHVA